MIQVAELIYIVPEKREAVLQQFLNPSVEEQRVADRKSTRLNSSH